jgi:hypothetical protein
MKILLEVLPLEKAKQADSDFTEPVQFLFAYPRAGNRTSCRHSFVTLKKYSLLHLYISIQFYVLLWIT